MLSKKIIILFSIFITLMSSCNSDVEIDPGNFENEEPISQFIVDFDGETWEADIVTATITNGVINITAFRNDNTEKVIINILSDQIGTYIISPEELVGGLLYEDNNEGGDAFVTNSNVLSGEINLQSINTVNQLLSGQFFFTGSRFIQLLDDEGNPVLDEEDNPILIEQTKDFTNGEFTNIIYTTIIEDPEPDPTGENEFFANLNGIEFVEESLVAVKSTIDGLSVISISAYRDGTNEEISFVISADVNQNNYLITDIIEDPTGDVIGKYINNVTLQTFVAGTGEGTGDVILPLLNITNHDVENKLIEGTFEFTGFETGVSDPIKVQITEGSFSVTYVE